MVVQCPQCLGRYRVADESKVPVQGTGVRCPGCSNIFTIYRIAADIELIPVEEARGEPTPEAPPVFEPAPSPGPRAEVSTAPAERGFETPSSVVEESVFEPKPEVFEPSPPTTFEEPTVEDTGEIIPEVSEPVAPEPVGVSAVPTFEPETETAISPQAQKQHDKAKRLARVLVKDILLYHGDKVEEGLRNGNLIDMVGDEIKKSWQYYKSELPEDVLNSTNYFKDALNKILAKGKKIFT
jgi:predicted Zn finger-like uncharacterized protein